MSTLGDVIGALSRNQTSSDAARQAGGGHVPFRDSKLTYLLKGSLLGEAKVAMICTASPAPRNVDETLSTLKFASRCRNVELKTAALASRGRSLNRAAGGTVGGVASRSRSRSLLSR